jgi:hypothetical protein
VGVKVTSTVQFALEKLCELKTISTGADNPGINYCKKLESGEYFINEAEIAHALKLVLIGRRE